MTQNGHHPYALGGHASAEALAGAYLAQVVSVQDPLKLARVQVRMLSFDGAPQPDGPIWARVVLPFAGDKRGAFMLPDVGDEVLVTFVNGDARFPIVVGGLWNGSTAIPETLGGDGGRVDRWTITGKAGTRIAIVEEAAGQPAIIFSTPGKVTGKLSDDGGGTIELTLPTGTSIKLDSSGVSIQTGGKVQVQASEVDVTAGQVSVNAAMSIFSGMVQCEVMQATTVISATYTPGAGNVW
ncbi:MAG: phage baseplate assembly protein V [Candidatus Binataceae bacterium]